MNSIIEGIFALGCMFFLAVGVIFLLSSPIYVLIDRLIKDPIEKKYVLDLYKKIVFFAALLILVGMGICTFGPPHQQMAS